MGSYETRKGGETLELKLPSPGHIAVKVDTPGVGTNSELTMMDQVPSARERLLPADLPSRKSSTVSLGTASVP